MVGSAKNDFVHAIDRWLTSYHATKGINGSPVGSAVGIAGRCLLEAIYTPRPITIDKICYRNQTAAGAGTFLRVGLYIPDPSTPFTPLGGKLIFDSGDIAANNTTVQSITVSPAVSIAKGFFWICVEMADNLMKVYSFSLALTFWADGANEQLDNSNSFDQAYGALPAIVPALSEIAPLLAGCAVHVSAIT